MKTRLAWLCAITFVLVCSAQPIQAQVITSAEIERGLRYRNTTPYDGEPFMQRYNYGLGGVMYFHQSARELWYLDYLDRVDRAYKFGYPMPADPFEAHEVIVQPPVAGQQPVVVQPESIVQPPVRMGVGFGGGFGFFRRR